MLLVKTSAVDLLSEELLADILNCSERLDDTLPDLHDDGDIIKDIQDLMDPKLFPEWVNTAERKPNNVSTITDADLNNNIEQSKNENVNTDTTHDTDQNNNDSESVTESDSQQTVIDNTADSKNAVSKSNKRTAKTRYSLRETSIKKRIQTEEKCTQPRKPKPRTRPPALSKYRRKTANSRERDRMTSMNTAFEELDRHLPQEGDSGKQTKMNTLRIAIDYIASLRSLLGYSDDGHSTGSSSEWIMDTSS